jgi:hypothetical protein
LALDAGTAHAGCADAVDDAFGRRLPSFPDAVDDVNWGGGHAVSRAAMASECTCRAWSR